MRRFMQTRPAPLSTSKETFMKRWQKTLSIAIATVALAAPVFAAGPVMDWDPAYFYSQSPGMTPLSQPAGGILRCVGTISAFGPPLADLNPTIPAIEYTFVLESLVSAGTVTIGPIATQFYTTNYTGGTIQVFADPSPDAVFAPNPPNALVPTSFLDLGLPILTGTFTRFTVATNNFTTFQVGNIEGDINWNGGTLIERFRGTNNSLCPGLFTGGATWNTAPSIGIPGYLFRHDGKIDLQCPVPTRKDSWSKLKQLYR
jgi:hypothetical protein